MVELRDALEIQFTSVEVDEATHTLSVSEKILDVKYTPTGSVTVTIPSLFATGRWYPVDITDTGGSAGTNNITLVTEGSEKINGKDSAVIESDNASFSLFTDGTNYFLK